jgi:cytidyltransferase-like protein
MDNIVVSGSFDDIHSRQVRFLEEAARHGPVYVYLWSDQAVNRLVGTPPKLPEQERKYFLEAVRFVHKVWILDDLSSRDVLPKVNDFNPDRWVVPAKEDHFQKQQFCASHQICYQVIHESALEGFPIAVNENGNSANNRKVLVTGCFDWFHSGHVRFFEETSGLGQLYVVVGHDENVRLLKGKDHPMFSQDERRYMVGAIRYVKQALISTGHGWMDAEPEIDSIQPDVYAVNEDGDKPEKREFCQKRGLEYVVLKRTPATGLPRRESTRLRGF